MCCMRENTLLKSSQASSELCVAFPTYPIVIALTSQTHSVRFPFLLYVLKSVEFCLPAPSPGLDTYSLPFPSLLSGMFLSLPFPSHHCWCPQLIQEQEEPQSYSCLAAVPLLLSLLPDWQGIPPRETRKGGETLPLPILPLPLPECSSLHSLAGVGQEWFWTCSCPQLNQDRQETEKRGTGGEVPLSTGEKWGGNSYLSQEHLKKKVSSCFCHSMVQKGV